MVRLLSPRNDIQREYRKYVMIMAWKCLLPSLADGHIFITIFSKSSWNTGSVTTMKEMFHGATMFNQDLSSWVSSVEVLHNKTVQRSLIFRSTYYSTTRRPQGRQQSHRYEWHVSFCHIIRSGLIGVGCPGSHHNGGYVSKNNYHSRTQQHSTSALQ